MVGKVVIIDYGSGNLRSVEKSFERAAREHGFAATIKQSSQPEEVADAERIVLPGQGAFKSCMEGLAARDGMLEAIEHAVLVKGRPFLGICVGMQLLAEHGEEFGGHPGLDWMDGVVAPMAGLTEGRPVPHMGWNVLTETDHHPVMQGCDGEAVYFAHSFHMAMANEAHILATADYGLRVTAAVGRDNIVGTQFHPEKSQLVGLRLISNFLAWDPS